MKDDMQADFATMLDDFAIATTVGGKSVNAIRNSKDLDIVYTELANKSVEYKFTLWYDRSDLTAAGASVPAVHDEIVISGTTYLVARRTDDPLEALVALDMVEQYG